MKNGIVVAILIRSKAGEEMQSLPEVRAIAGAGLEGDAYCDGNGSFNKKSGVGNRQVTLINERFFLGSGFSFVESRRNIVVRRFELIRCIGQEFRIGNALFRGRPGSKGYCEPCDRPSNLSKNERSFEEAFEDCGGLIVEVIKGGLIRVGDQIIPPPKNY